MFISIKWKLTLSMVIIGVCLIVTYVLLAKQIFESDKISYVFDAESHRISSVTREFNQRIDQSLFYSRSLLETLDPQTKTLSESGKKLFDRQTLIQSISVHNLATEERIFSIGDLQKIDKAKRDHDSTSGGSEKMRIRFLSSDLLYIRLNESLNENSIQISLVVKTPKLIPDRSGFFVLSQEEIIFPDSSSIPLGDKELLNYIIHLRPAEGTSLYSTKTGDVLVSKAKTSIEGVEFWSIIPKSQVMQALQVLFNRSIVFVILSGFFTTIISILLSKGLTQNLFSLTESAYRIGRGDFSELRPLRSNDEVGILSKAFIVMGQEIGRLLQETKDKTRMEEELKTARYVQESLLPQESHYSKGLFEAQGLYLTSTECSGDWWYYFERDQYLFIAIADATGHGTPAALITSAARSVFSMLENSNMSLTEMMSAWDHAVASCSNQRVFMTAQLYQIDTQSGAIEFINACHEPPAHLRPGRSVFDGDYLSLHTNSTLGERRKIPWETNKIQLDRGEALVLLTDGLFAVENKAQKTLSDRKFLRSLLKSLPTDVTVNALIVAAQTIIDEHRFGDDFPDDLTLVALCRKA